MKNVRQLVLLSMVAMVAVACGKNNTTGGSDDDKSKDPIQNFTQNSVKTVKLSEVREKFSKMNTSSNGLDAGEIVYHIGPSYMEYDSGPSFEFQVSGCINLIFTQIGNCNTNGGYQSYWDSIISMGSYKVVKSVSSSTVSYDKLVDASATKLYYESKTYSKNTYDYRDMLALGADTGFEVAPRASVAQVTMSNGQKIEAYLIERFDGYHNLKYVVSPKLPLIANPIAILNGYGQFTGALKGIGNARVRHIQVNFHTTGYNGQVVPGGYNQLYLQ